MTPGKHDDMPIVDPFYPSPVYHFQDDAVDGTVIVDPIDDPIMPFVQQDVSGPQHYLDDIDGPALDSRRLASMAESASSPKTWRLNSLPFPSLRA